MNRTLPWAALSMSLAGCAGLATNMIADAVGGENSAFATDDDPALVRDAIPFGLKTMEALLQGSPDNRKLLLGLASGFTQYANAFLQQEAEMVEEKDPDYARAQMERARGLYARAHEYGLRGLEVEHKGFRAELDADPAKAVARIKDKEDVPFLYWTAASLALLVSISKDNLELVGRLPQVEALMGRALVLDPDWNAGAIHEFYVIYDGGRSEAMGGSVARAKEHYERALELTGGRKLSPYVAWAETVSVQRQDRREFDSLLDHVLAFDVDEAPSFRLANVLSQTRARWLQSRASELFLEE